MNEHPTTCSSTSKKTEWRSAAVAQTPPCRYHLGLGIYNVQTAVEGTDGNKRSYLLHLCGQLLRLVIIPCHVEGEPHQWTRATALSFAAEIDGHVLGTLCAVTMALNHHRQSVSAGKTNAIPTEPLGRLQCQLLTAPPPFQSSSHFYPHL